MTVMSPSGVALGLVLGLAAAPGCLGGGNARIELLSRGTTCSGSGESDVSVLPIGSCSSNVTDDNVMDTFFTGALSDSFPAIQQCAGELVNQNMRSFRALDCTAQSTITLQFFTDSLCNDLNGNLSLVYNDADPMAEQCNKVQLLFTMSNVACSSNQNNTVQLEFNINLSVEQANGTCIATGANTGSSSGNEKLSAGDDVGITIGALLLLAILVVAGIYWHRSQSTAVQRELNAVSLDLQHVEEQSMKLLFDEEALDNSAIGSRGHLDTDAASLPASIRTHSLGKSNGSVATQRV